MFNLHGIPVPTIMFTPELMDQHIQWGRMDTSCDKCGHGTQLTYNRDAEPGTLNAAMWLNLVPDEFEEFAREKLEIAGEELMNGPRPVADERSRLEFIKFLTDAIIRGIEMGELNRPINFIDIKGDMQL